MASSYEEFTEPMPLAYWYYSHLEEAILGEVQ
jgi:hypothetical protein